MGLVVLGVLQQNFVHVGAGVLEQLVGRVEDDEGDLAVTENAQLVGLLHEAELALSERHLGMFKVPQGEAARLTALSECHKLSVDLNAVQISQS